MSETYECSRISSAWDADVVAGHSVIRKPSEWENFRSGDWNLILMVEGNGSGRSGGGAVAMRQGAFYLFSPVEGRRFFSTTGWRSYWAHFPLRVPPEWPEAAPGVYALTPPAADFRRGVRELMEALQLAMGGRRGWRLLALNLIENIILRGNMLSRPALADGRLLKAEALLGDFEQAPDMDRIAALCGMSRSVFYARFREACGITPRAYRERAQLNQARILLESTSLSLAEVASRCGMNDLAQFFKRFRHCFGTTPKQYRERVRESV